MADMANQRVVCAQSETPTTHGPRYRAHVSTNLTGLLSVAVYADYGWLGWADWLGPSYQDRRATTGAAGRQFQCPHCPTRWTTRYKLNRHLRTHGSLASTAPTQEASAVRDGGGVCVGVRQSAGSRPTGSQQHQALETTAEPAAGLQTATTVAAAATADSTGGTVAATEATTTASQRTATTTKLASSSGGAPAAAAPLATVATDPGSDPQKWLHWVFRDEDKPNVFCNFRVVAVVKLSPSAKTAAHADPVRTAEPANGAKAADTMDVVAEAEAEAEAEAGSGSGSGVDGQEEVPSTMVDYVVDPGGRKVHTTPASEMAKWFLPGGSARWLSLKPPKEAPAARADQEGSPAGGVPARSFGPKEVREKEPKRGAL